MWETFRDRESGRVYYAERETGESSWAPPPIGVELIPYPEDDILKHWRAYRSPAHANELFFLNSLTNERTWNRPLKFYGMPEGEDEDHEKGPFIQYEDEQDRLYWYNPRTKLVTRHRPNPSTIGTEQAVYSELRARGLLWEPSILKAAREQNESSESSSTSSESEDESSSQESEEEDDEELKRPFIEMLHRTGVAKISKWSNWISKIQAEPEFKASPAEKVREWFETHIKSLIQNDASSKVSIIADLKSELEAWIRVNTSERLRVLNSIDTLLTEGPQELAEKLSQLSSIEKNAVLVTVKKRLNS